jgi:ketosteroid isomerase-like protein
VNDCGVDASGVAVEFLSRLQAARRSSTEEAWSRITDLLNDKVEWRFAAGDTGAAWWNRLVGVDDVLRMLRSPGSGWIVLHSETVNTFSDGEQVLVEQMTGMPDNFGEGEWRKPVAHVFVVRDGVIAQIRTYRNDLQTNVHGS